MENETAKLFLKASFKKDIFNILEKYNVGFESKIAGEFEQLIDKINFKIEESNDR